MSLILPTIEYAMINVCDLKTATIEEPAELLVNSIAKHRFNYIPVFVKKFEFKNKPGVEIYVVYNIAVFLAVKEVGLPKINAVILPSKINPQTLADQDSSSGYIPLYINTSYLTMSKKELIKECKIRGYKQLTKKTKKDLIEHLAEYDQTKHDTFINKDVV